MKTTIITLKLVMVLVLQPVAASIVIPIADVNYAFAGETNEAGYCPRKVVTGCNHMEICFIVGHFSCDMEVGTMPFLEASGKTATATDRLSNAGNYYFSFVSGPPLRPPRYS